MIRPTGRALLLLALLLPVAVLPTVFGASWLWMLWFGGVAAFALLLLVDFAMLPRRRRVQLTYDLPGVVYLGDEVHFEVEVSVTRRTTLVLALTFDGAVLPVPPADIVAGPESPTTLRVPLQPQRRGILRLVAEHVRLQGPLGLLRAEHDRAHDAVIAVVPNVRAARRRALRMISQRDFQGGTRVERYLGDGSEFESLRDYVLGMDRRAVDWKSSARHRTLLCREFRAERDHSVVLCIDTGRLMREPLGGMPRLDHAIHAALQLGCVCLRTGDRVGMHAFAEAPQQFVTPQAGMPTLQVIQDRMKSLDYGVVETNFTLGMTDLLQRLRRRSLVVLFTDFVDSITAELMLRHVRWLAQRHLLLFVAMRDPLLDRLSRQQPSTLADVHRAVIAEDLQRERELVLERARRAGAQVIDAGIDELAADLVERYLAVKRRELV